MGYEVKKRFQTGDLCERTGEYHFDGYVEGNGPEPEPEERVLHLQAGETFPHVVSKDRNCWWKLDR